MPKIVKQRQMETKPKTAPTGSILGRAIPVSELEQDYIKFVLYGVNRVGKTTLACQFPKPLLLISCEPAGSGGAKSVKLVPGVELLRLKNVGEVHDLAKELENDTTYKTHVIDTVTSLQDLVLQNLMGLEEVPIQLNWGLVSQDQYRERSEQTKELLRLYHKLPAHTVFCAQEKDHQPPEGRKNKLISSLQIESFFAADLGGATVKWMHDACDYVGRLYLDKEIKKITRSHKSNNKVIETVEERETGKIVRRLRTILHPNFAAGFRSERPKDIPEYIENPSYEKIIALIR